MVMNKKTQYCQDIIFAQLGLSIQLISNENPRQLIHEHQQTDSKVYREKQLFFHQEESTQCQRRTKLEDWCYPTSRLTIQI